MHFRAVAVLPLFVCSSLLVGSGQVRADFVVLKTGGSIRGELLTAPSSTQKSTVSIQTVSGSLVTIAFEDVESITPRRLVLEQYESLRRVTPEDDVDSQWAVAEWCREHSLKDQREEHLLLIIEQEPDHAAARRGLGHTQHEGRWASRDEIMISRGYVKHKGKYVLPQELELLKQEQQETEAEKAWYKRVKMWHGWLTSDRSERQTDGATSLQAISDPNAVPALYRTFSDEPNELLRLTYIAILTRIENPKVIGPLAYQSIKDESISVREAAIQGIPRKDWPRAIPFYIKLLKHDVNVVVNRAAIALGEIGDTQVVPKLIDALITRHRYRTQVPDQQPFGFTPTGQMVPNNTVTLPPDIGVMLLTGQLPQGVQINQVQPPGQQLRTKEVVIRKDEPNPAVLAALKRLTGQDFGYQEAHWKAWFNKQKNSAGAQAARP